MDRNRVLLNNFELLDVVDFEFIFWRQQQESRSSIVSKTNCVGRDIWEIVGNSAIERDCIPIRIVRRKLPALKIRIIKKC